MLFLTIMRFSRKNPHKAHNGRAQFGALGLFGTRTSRGIPQEALYLPPSVLCREIFFCEGGLRFFLKIQEHTSWALLRAGKGPQRQGFPGIFMPCTHSTHTLSNSTECAHGIVSISTGPIFFASCGCHALVIVPGGSFFRAHVGY